VAGHQDLKGGKSPRRGTCSNDWPHLRKDRIAQEQPMRSVNERSLRNTPSDLIMSAVLTGRTFLHGPSHCFVSKDNKTKQMQVQTSMCHGTHFEKKDRHIPYISLLFGIMFQILFILHNTYSAA